MHLTTTASPARQHTTRRTVRRAAALLGLLVALAFPNLADAQQVAAVHGRITADGRPVGGARIVATRGEGPGNSDQSDADGRYRITGLAPGRYRIEVVALGYSSRVAEVALGAGEVRELDLELEPDPIALGEVEVVGVGRDRFESTYAATRVEGEVEGDVARSWNPVNPYDALRLVPGVAYNSGNRFGEPTRIRGASGWATPDVIEDFPAVREASIGTEDGGFAADFGAMVPAIALAGVEVKKGSLGVLYGADADGGVIVNKLKRGTERGTAGVWVETSPLGEALYMADAGGRRGAVDLYVAGKLLEGDYEDFVDEQGRVLEDDDLFSGLARIGWMPMPTARLELTAVGGRDRIHYVLPQRDDPATALDESDALPPTLFRTKNSSGFYGLTFDHAPTEALGYEVGYSLFRQRGVRFSITDDEAHRDRPEVTHTGFGNAYWNATPAAGLDLSMKAGFEWSSHVQKEEARNSDKSQAFEDRSVFAASTLVLRDALTLSAGARLVHAEDDFRGDQGFVVHDLGAAYDIARSGTRLLTSWSTGYSRFKGFAYFFGSVEAAGGYDVARTETVEGSVEQRLPSPWGSGLVTATLFRLWTDGIPIFAGSGEAGIITQDTRAMGFELSANYPLGAIATLNASYAWQDAEVVATTHPDGAQVGNTAGWIPQHTAAAALMASPLAALDVSLLATYDSGRRRQTVNPTTDEVSVATRHGYTRVNASAAWQVRSGVSLLLRVENLLDEKDLGYTLQTRGPDGGIITEPSVARDPGRLLFVGFELRYR